MYDIISKICDHELAEIITNKMRKHTQEKEKEKEKEQEKEKEKEKEKEQEQEQEQEKENEVPEPTHPTPEKDPKQASQLGNFRPRQSLADYYISHPPQTFQPYSHHNAQEDFEDGGSEKAQDQDTQASTEKVACLCVILCSDLAGSEEEASTKEEQIHKQS
jgi:hypothetical protein